MGAHMANTAAFDQTDLDASNRIANASQAHRKNSHLVAAKRYALAAIGCAAFALIYAQFSHGVYSPFMTLMFAIPLIAGTVPSLICHLLHIGELPVTARKAWALGVATLAIASCLRGIFDIAGAASPFLVVYIAAAVACAIIAVASCIKDRRTTLCEEA